MPKGKESPSLRQVFLNLLLVRLFFPLLIIELIAMLGLVHLEKRNFTNHQDQVVQSISHIIDYHLDHGGRILDAVARVAETSENKDLSVFIKSAQEAYGYFETIYYLDKNEKIALMSPYNPRYIGLDMSKLKKLKKLEGEGNFHISSPFISLNTGYPTVYLIRSLSDGGDVIGELNLNLFQKEITAIMDKSNKDFVFILDQTGTVLAHPNSDLVKQQTNLSYIEIFHNILAGKSNSSYIYNGSRVISSAFKVERTGWVVIDQVSLSAFLSLYAWTAGLALLASLAVWGILVWNLRNKIQKYVISPFEQLSEGTNALTLGNFSKANFLSSTNTTFAELNKLSLDFQFMSKNLQLRENALLKSENRYRGLFDRVPIGLFRATLTGKILDINPTAIYILGFSNREQVLKTNIFDLLYEPLTVGRQDKTLNEEVCHCNNLEVRLQRYDGTIIWVQMNTHVVNETEESEQHFEGSIQDITERKNTENKIKEQQEFVYKAEKERREALEKALVMKDEFISLISHEFKTPINVIYSAVQLIESVYSNQISNRVKELIGNIKQNTFRQLRLANNLLDITRFNSGQFKIHMRNVDIVLLTEAITESVKLYANQKNIKISFQSIIKNKTISIDDEKYERIILNILSNAIKFTESYGNITVTLSEETESNLIQVKIADTGIGIPKDKQELIFERFGQVNSNLSRQAEGTGIGLSIVNSLVNILEGTIELKSEVGVGSTFIITLPAKKEVGDNEFMERQDVNDRLISEIKVEFSDIYF